MAFLPFFCHLATLMNRSRESTCNPPTLPQFNPWSALRMSLGEFLTFFLLLGRYVILWLGPYLKFRVWGLEIRVKGGWSLWRAHMGLLLPVLQEYSSKHALADLKLSQSAANCAERCTFPGFDAKQPAVLLLTSRLSLQRALICPDRKRCDR